MTLCAERPCAKGVREAQRNLLKRKGRLWRPFLLNLIETLVAILTRSLALLAALDAGALISLTATHLSDNAGLGAASLEALERAVQRLAFLDMHFGHLYFPPSDAPGSILSAQ